VLGIVECVEDTSGVVLSQDGWQATVAFGARDHADGVGIEQHVSEEEPQGRNSLSVIGGRYVVALGALKEIGPYVLRAH
jgi:hypothetical protein